MRLGVVVASLVVLAVSACASERKNEKRRDDASNYNTQLGIDYMNQGDIPLAKEKLDRALKENPDNAKVHTARAMLFDRMHLPSQAESEFQTPAIMLARIRIRRKSRHGGCMVGIATRDPFRHLPCLFDHGPG